VRIEMGGRFPGLEGAGRVSRFLEAVAEDLKTVLLERERVERDV